MEGSDYGGGSVVMIKYNAGNIISVSNAFERLGVDVVLSDDPQVISSASKVIFPGVGEASNAMMSLRNRGLDRVIPTLRQPLLGICVGMQLLCDYSEENNTECLGIIPARVTKFKPNALENNMVKVPQVGWNAIYDLQSPLFKDISEDSFMYFVHSYFVPIGEHTIGTTDYTQPFSAAVQKGNFYGVQFHIEKSGIIGEKMLRNFLDLKT